MNLNEARYYIGSGCTGLASPQRSGLSRVGKVVERALRNAHTHCTDFGLVPSSGS